MSERIKQWWRDHAEYASGLSRAAWDELDAAIREDENSRLERFCSQCGLPESWHNACADFSPFPADAACGEKP